MTQAYPNDVLFERNVELNIKGRAYRAFSSGASAGGGVSTSTQPQSTKSDGRKIVGGQQSTDEVVQTTDTRPLDWTDMLVYEVQTNAELIFGGVFARNDQNGSVDFNVRLYDKNENRVLYRPYQVWGVPPANPVQTTQLYGNTTDYDPTGHDIAIQCAFTADEDGSEQLSFTCSGVLNEYESHTHDVQIDDHTHDPDPGISDFGDLYPENIDVVVNGTTVAPDVAGDGASDFETTVDLSGELTPGFNEIEVTSDSLGHIEASLGGRLTLENTL
jgi:hypothetical protein